MPTARRPADAQRLLRASRHSRGPGAARWRYPFFVARPGLRDVLTLRNGLPPPDLYDRGVWDPAEEYWGEPGEPIGEDFERIRAAGPRPEYEMEQVLPGQVPEDVDDDILRASALNAAGRSADARRLLRQLLAEDLRCIDAHGHLGNFAFDRSAESALPHFEAGVGIGELSLPIGFGGVLPWGWVDNRPFLRCLHWLGLCHWRLGDFRHAEEVFDAMLWLNPSDNQGERMNLPLVRDRRRWTADE